MEAILNTLGGDENIDGILRYGIKVELNFVHRELNEINQCYEKDLIAAGAIVLRDNNKGTRDIVLPVDCDGSEESAFYKMERTLVQKGLSFSVNDVEKYPFDSHKTGKIKQYVSIRNTMEYMSKNKGELPRCWTETYKGCDYLCGRSFFCFIEQYADIFAKDWLEDRRILPIAFGVHSGNRCLVRHSFCSTVRYECGILADYYGPWLTV